MSPIGAQTLIDSQVNTMRRFMKTKKPPDFKNFNLKEMKSGLLIDS